MTKYNEILSRLRCKLILPGFEDIVVPSMVARAKRIADYLEERVDRMDQLCEMCREKNAKESIYGEYFDSPWDTEGEMQHFCSEECREHNEDSSWTDFAYRYCDGCSRCICERSPRNGWHTHFRIVNECELLCLKCYEEEILEKGCEESSFSSGMIPGVFFSQDNHEPLDAGYEVVDGYGYCSIASSTQAKQFCDAAIRLIESGNKVVVGYERMAIGGLEGCVTMFAKGEGDETN